MIIKFYFKLIKDFVRLAFNSDGIPKLQKFILKSIKNGTYMDIGCYHPFKESHTALLFKKGWSGINIDISKESISLFKILRPNDLNLNVGLALKNGKQRAYFEKNISTVSSLDKTHIKKIGRKNKFMRNINVYTLKKIRELYNIKKIDFLKMDCESLDSKIILNCDIRTLNCRYLCVEVLPQEVFGWNYIEPKKKTKNYYKNYFVKSEIYLKLKKNFKLISNDDYAFLLKNKTKLIKS